MKVLFLFPFLFSPLALAEHSAKVNLQPLQQSSATGTVTFLETKAGVKVQYNIRGLGKNARHGFHIHEKGDCSSPDGKSAGPHYHKIAETGGTSSDNPQKFAGDMPELKADKNGEASGSFFMRHISLSEQNPIIGRAVIVHGGKDDITKPSAPRIACGKIEAQSH